jgi:hypothetical protein
MLAAKRHTVDLAMPLSVPVVRVGASIQDLTDYLLHGRWLNAYARRVTW